MWRLFVFACVCLCLCVYLCLLVCLCGVKMKRACEKGDIREVNRILLKKPQLSPPPTTQTPDHNQQHQQQQQQQQHQQHRQDDVSNEDLNNGLPIKGIWESSRLTFEQSIQFAQIETLDEDYIYMSGLFWKCWGSSAIGIEKEVFIPPCVRFRVEDFVDMGNGLIEFQLSYSTPPRELIELVPRPHFLKEWNLFLFYFCFIFLFPSHFLKE